jgi:anthranilate 1,2-dioxygenase small subunit
VKCRSNYLVVRTTGDGNMMLYSAGVYLDKVVLNDEGAQFAERVVVPDSRRIETLLVIPL